MRQLTKQVAFDKTWDEATAERVADMFSSMSSHWTADHDKPERYAPLRDALLRGQVPAGRAIELGSGTGLGTRELAAHFDDVVALDRSEGMLSEAPASYGARILGDAAALPFGSESADAIVLVNMMLFPNEVDRVLRSEGAIVWVNTIGEHTPIYLSAQDVHDALPGEWTVTHSRSGTGTWAVARRV